MTTATDMRDLYLLAEQDILNHGVTTRFADQEKTVADLNEIRAGRQEWERRVSEEQRASRGLYSGHSLARIRG